MMSNMKTLQTALVLFLLHASHAYAAHWQKEGERLTYSVGYSFFSIGNAEIAYAPKEENAYSIVGRAWTHNGVSSLMSLNDRLTFTGAHTQEAFPFQSQLFETRLFENDYSAQKEVRFNHEKNTASYTNLKDATPAKIRDIEPFGRDLFSALYHLRSSVKEIKTGDIYTLPVVDLTKNYTLNLHVLKKEHIKTPWGKVNAFKVKPVLEGISNKRKKDKLYIWIEANEERTPLRFEIDMKIGSFVAKIIKKDIYSGASTAPSNLPENGETFPMKRKKNVNQFDNF